MTSDGLHAETLQAGHRAAVLGNAITFDPLWNRPCCAYNVQAELGREAVEQLAVLQEKVLSVEPELLRCPVRTLHISVLSLLGVRVDYGRDKAAIWEDHRVAWTMALSRAARAARAVTVRFGPVVVTDSAIIVLAEPAGPLNELRRTLADGIRSAGGSPSVPGLVHTSIFRYARPLRDPRQLLGLAGLLHAGADVTIDRLVLSKELVYPSMETEIFGSVPVGGSAG